MGRQRIVLTVEEEIDCPLFRVGDRMVLDLPGVDLAASSNLCTLALSKFLPVRDALDCGAFELFIRSYRFQCPRLENPVLFQVSEVEEEAPAFAGDAARSVEALKSIPVFRSLSARALEGILRGIRIETFGDGERILERGQPGRAFYIVYRGQVEVLGQTEEGMTRSITRLGQKQCFGEISLLTGAPCTGTVRAIGTTALLVLDKPEFERVVQENPILAGLFTRLLATRLGATNQKIARDQEKAFSGKLSVLALADVAQSLGEARRSGTLVLEDGREEGSIGFRDGRIYEIRLGALEGEEAFYRLLAWPDGEFWFDARRVPPEDRVGRDIMELLLEGMRRQDETGQPSPDPAP